MSIEPKVGIVVRLGVAQTLAWASSYYLPAMLATSMARDLGISTPTVFAAFSAALIVSALVGPPAGRLIDRLGGRQVLVWTSIIFAVGLGALGFARSPTELFLAWLIIGIGMGSGLYEAAFSALVVLYGDRSRSAITGITLIAGFASTVGWPLSTFLEAHIGWRGACFSWAVLHLTLGLALNLSLPRQSAAYTDEVTTVASNKETDSPLPADITTRRWASFALAFVFAATWFTSTAMATHLPRLLQAGVRH